MYAEVAAARIVLVGYALSVAFHFYFPFITLFLIDRGLSPSLATAVLSGSLLFTAFSLPYSGSQLDQGHIGRVLFPCAVGVTFGLSGFLWAPQGAAHLLAPSAFVFIIATATVYASARRVTEGLALRENLGRAAALTYSIESLGLGSAALLAFFFIDKFPVTLIVLDCLTTLLFIAVLGIVLLSLKKNSRLCADRPPRPEIQEVFGFVTSRWRFTVPFMLVLFSVFAHMGALQLLYREVFAEPKKWIGVVKVVNTGTVLLFSALQVKKIIRLSMLQSFTIAALCVALGYFGAAWALNPIGIISTTFLWSVGEAILYPAMTQAVLSSFESERSGLAGGTRDMMVRVGLVGSPLIASMLDLSQISTFGLAYGALPIVGLVLMYAVQGRTKSSVATER